MNIEVGRYKVISKGKNVQLHQFYEKKTRTEDGNPQFAWRPFGNYPTVESALSAILDNRMKESDAMEVKELLWEIRKAKEDITTELQKVQVRA